MSDSVQPHRWQRNRLLCPWDSPRKNTGVGCHFLLQCIKMKSESEVTQSCPTFSNPTDCSLPGSSIYGILQARVLAWVAIAFSVGSVRHIYFCSHLKVALLAYLHCHQPTTCSWNYCQCLCPQPHPTGRSFLGRDLCGSFFGSPPLRSASWRVVWASLSPLSSPSVPHGLCALQGFLCAPLSAPRTQPLPQGLCALQRFVCAAVPLTPRSPSPSAPRGLSALQRFVCCASLSTFFPAGLCGLLWVSQAHCLVRATVRELLMS